MDLLDRLATRAPVLLTGPVGPDGDSLGACLALQRVLAIRGTAAEVAGNVPERYRWMPGADAILPDGRVAGPFGAVVILDGDRLRLTAPVRAAFQSARFTAIIDHHATTSADGYDEAWIDRTAGSTCEMLHRALEGWGVRPDRDLATLLYCGILFDTGGFRHSNTTPDVFRRAADLLELGIDHADVVTRLLHQRTRAGLAAAGRIYAEATLACDGRLCVGTAPSALTAGLPERDLEGVVESLLMVDGVEVASLISERPGGEVKHSLRSRGRVDVARLAGALAPTGGGHPKAAGAVVRATLAEARDQLEAAVAAALTADR